MNKNQLDVLTNTTNFFVIKKKREKKNKRFFLLKKNSTLKIYSKQIIYESK